jgi:hypothetical protein
MYWEIGGTLALQGAAYWLIFEPLLLSGGLLDYEAVTAGLDDGRIGALGLDVQWQEPFDPDDPIAKHPRHSSSLLLPEN